MSFFASLPTSQRTYSRLPPFGNPFRCGELVEGSLSVLRMPWSHGSGDGSAGASPYRAHPTSDACRRSGGSWKARFRFLRMHWGHEPGRENRPLTPTLSPFGRGEGEGSAARVAIGPVHGKPTFAFCACIGAMNRNEGTDPSPRPSPLRKGRGRSVACARGSLVGSWKAQFPFCACIGVCTDTLQVWMDPMHAFD